jgi:hypothetical protein
MINAGGHVFEVGVGLNHFNPVFYVDITGIHQIKEKSKRLEIWLAGVNVQMFLLAIGLLLEFQLNYTAYWIQLCKKTYLANVMALRKLNFLLKTKNFLLNNNLNRYVPRVVNLIGD